MIKKRHIAFFILTIALLYIVAPYFFERNFYFNEILALIGLIIFCIKGLKIKNSSINRLFIILLIVSIVHAVTSLLRADHIYLYLRNSVIVYSMFTFFLGYFLYDHLGEYIRKCGSIITGYVIIFLFFPVSNILFDRFGMSTVFPVIIRNVRTYFILPILIIVTIVYSINYQSSTILILSLFYLFLLIIPGYRFFRFSMLAILVSSVCLFIYLLPFLTINPLHYSHNDNVAIWEIINSHPLLKIDPNSTWRLVIWKQIIIDLFPYNILGIGFGTPALNYFPIEDVSKLSILPYVLGGHNSYIYLFGRLGIGFIILIGLIYSAVFKDFFYYKNYYYSNRSILVFFGFFAVSIMALFNPVLETPIYASSYWLLLGFTAKVIDKRKLVYSSEK